MGQDENNAYNLILYTDLTQSTLLGNFARGDVQCFDSNNDGWKDIIVCGKDKDNKAILNLYQNNKGNLEKQQEIQGIRECVSTLNDFDSNNYLDLVAGGETESGDYKSVVIFNTVGNFNSEKEIIPKFKIASVDSGDYNNDGISDLVLQGYDKENKRQSSLMLFDGNSFTRAAVDILTLTNSVILALDYNKDNNLDIFFLGHPGSEWHGGLSHAEPNFWQRFREPCLSRVTKCNTRSALWCDSTTKECEHPENTV
jgi:hypothetical protein